MRAKLSLAELKDMIHAKYLKENLGLSLFPNGLPLGGITALSGCGKTEFAVQLLAEHPDLQAAWIEESFSVFPFGFLQRNIQLHRVLFIESGNQTEWAVLQTLRSQAFAVVVLYCEHCNDRVLRRFQLAAEKANACFLWLTSSTPNGWMVSLKLQVHRTDNGLHTTLLKRKF